MMEIQLHNRGEVHETRWNFCVENAFNSSPFGYCESLDLLCDDWIGLVVGNYEVVMPIPLNKRLGYSLIQMPIDVQQLGIYGSPAKIALVTSAIFRLLKIFKFISFNSSLEPIIQLEGVKVEQRTTYQLSLNQDYNSIYAAYSRRVKRNLKFFSSKNLQVGFDSNVGNLLDLRVKMAADVAELKLSQERLINYQQLISHWLSKGLAQLVTAFGSNHEPMSSGLFIKTQQGYIFFLLASSAEGRSHRAAFAVVDYFIKNNCYQKRVFDFWGSDISSIAQFNSGFGARPLSYHHYQKNDLPWVISFMKRNNLYKKMKDILG
ncbi:hypothetical protein [Carboxylicivirga taeanensis]|uniref:hypothetical protein n=1 Tax=Carboxylicivirga taeanensis TaxID=1416875 RepID=UPI003F6DA94E